PAVGLRLPPNEGTTPLRPDLRRTAGEGRTTGPVSVPAATVDTMASNSDPWRPRRLHPPIDDLLPPAGKPGILPGVTPSWPGHEYGPTPVPAPAPSIPGLPEGVRRTRAELEALRDDAARQFHA